MRGKAKDGKDLGAYQYSGEVVFVKPDGNDSAEGTSVASAWKTLAHGGRALRAGQTLYIFPGTYSETLVLRDKAAPAGQKTRVRVHGKGAATVGALEIKGCTSLEVANLTVSGAGRAGIDIQGSHGITLLNCISNGSKAEGVSIAGSDRISVQRCALWGNAIGLRASQSRDVELVSSLVGKNTQTQVLLAEGTRDYHGNFNAFIGANLGEVAEGSGKAGDIAAWRTLCGSEAASLVSTAAPVAPEKGDFRVPAGTILATSGLYDSPVGPHGVFAGQRLARKRIEGLEVVSVTSTSANILWYTPGRMTGTALQWGLTPEYGNLHDRTSDYMSEFELVHTVSLINLKPGTTYHFRPGGLDVLKEEPAITWDDQDYTFTTAKEDPAPRQLHVATTGDDSHDGLTPQTPWKTLHKAAREARAGDTVTIAPGRYAELLRPLQTGTAEDRRITFRAEKPLSVFLEGGMIKFTRPGRPHVVQLHSKAFVTIENLTGMYVSEGIDYGGYRDGWGYAGIFRVSGGGMNEFKGCVADARYRWASGFVFFEGGVMPGMIMPPYAAKVSDSATLACWRAVQGRVKRAPLILDHNIYYVSLTGMYSPYGGGEKWVSRNCIYQDLCDQKRAGPYTTFWSSTVYDSDYSCFAWMPEGTRFVANGTKELGRVEEEGHVAIVGLKAWQDFSKRDLHSIEHTPDYGLTPLEFGKGRGFDLRPLTIQDFVLPKDSPLRGRGEGGSDIGVRWEHYLDPAKSASKPVATAPPAAAGATADPKSSNLLLNASFEDVDPRHNIPDGWNIAGGVLNGNTMEMDDRVARNGKRSLRMKFNPGSTSEIVLTRDCLPPIVEGKTYTYSAWVKTKDLAGKAYLFLFQYPPPFTEENQALSEATVTGTSDWTRLSIVFKVRKGLTNAQLRCGVTGPSGEAWFDDVAIVEGALEPEPASAGK